MLKRCITRQEACEFVAPSPSGAPSSRPPFTSDVDVMSSDHQSLWRAATPAKQGAPQFWDDAPSNVSNPSDAQRPCRIHAPPGAVSSPKGSRAVGARVLRRYNTSNGVHTLVTCVAGGGSTPGTGFHDALARVLVRRERHATAQRFFLLWHTMSANVWSRRQKELFHALKAHTLSEAEDVVLHEVRLAKLDCAHAFFQKRATGELATVFQSWKVVAAAQSTVPPENKPILDYNFDSGRTLPRHAKGATEGSIAPAPFTAELARTRAGFAENPLDPLLYSDVNAAENGDNGSVQKNPNIAQADDEGTVDPRTFVIDSGLGNINSYDTAGQIGDPGGQKDVRTDCDTKNGTDTRTSSESMALIFKHNFYTLYREEKGLMEARRRKKSFCGAAGGVGLRKQGDVEDDNETGICGKSRRMFGARDSRSGTAMVGKGHVIAHRDVRSRSLDTDLRWEDLENDHGVVEHTAISTLCADTDADTPHHKVVSDNLCKTAWMNGHHTNTQTPRLTDLTMCAQPPCCRRRPNGVDSDTAENAPSRFAPLLGGGQHIGRAHERGVHSSQSVVARRGTIGNKTTGTMLSDGNHQADRSCKSVPCMAQHNAVEWIDNHDSDSAQSTIVLSKCNTAGVALWKVVERERRAYALRAWKNIAHQQHVQEMVAERIVWCVDLRGKRELLRVAFEWWRSWWLDFRCHMLAAAIERQNDLLRGVDRLLPLIGAPENVPSPLRCSRIGSLRPGSLRSSMVSKYLGSLQPPLDSRITQASETSKVSLNCKLMEAWNL